MKIAFYGKIFNSEKTTFIQKAIDLLLKQNIHLSIHHAFWQQIENYVCIPSKFSIFENHTELTDIQYLISFGGDGTLLDSILFVQNKNIPILGINTGRLGFLSGVSIEDTENALNQLLNKEYTLDKRSLLEVYANQHKLGTYNFSLNDFYVHKKDTQAMITIHTYLNNQFLNTYWADGLIVSTPTGSTAYSLSCGGPIISPEAPNFIITPIAPHNLTVRPFVVPDDIKIKINVEARSEHIMASMDSRTHTLESSCEIEIQKAAYHILLIKLHNQSFYSTIRHKLMWGLDKRG